MPTDLSHQNLINRCVCICKTALLLGSPDCARLYAMRRGSQGRPGCHSCPRRINVCSHLHQNSCKLVAGPNLAEETQAAVCEILHTGPRARGWRRPRSRCSTGVMTAMTFSSVHNPATGRYVFSLPWQPPGMHGTHQLCAQLLLCPALSANPCRSPSKAFLNL